MQDLHQIYIEAVDIKFAQGCWKTASSRKRCRRNIIQILLEKHMLSSTEFGGTRTLKKQWKCTHKITSV